MRQEAVIGALRHLRAVNDLKENLAADLHQFPKSTRIDVLTTEATGALSIACCSPIGARAIKWHTPKPQHGPST